MQRLNICTKKGGRKTTSQKLKFLTYSFFKLYFAPHTTINCKKLYQHSASAVTGFSSESTRLAQKNSLDLKKITRFKIVVSNFAVFIEMIYLFTLSPKNFNIICKFVKIDHTEARKVPYQSSDFFQELKTTPLTEYCKPTNATFN